MKAYARGRSRRARIAAGCSVPASGEYSVRKHVYKALRNEATQSIMAVRQLGIGENAAFAIILVELLKTKSLYELLALDSVLLGLIYFAARLGRDWFIQAYRQLSYIFVAYELVERNVLIRLPEKNYFDLWVLANRSESFFSGDMHRHGAVPTDPTPRKPFRTHTPGRELRTFLMHQFLLLVIAIAATAFAAIRISFALVPALHPSLSAEHLRQLYLSLLLNSPLLVIDMTLSVLLLVYLRKQIGQADEAIMRLTLNWLKYQESRGTRDNEYLAAKGFELRQPTDNFSI